MVPPTEPTSRTPVLLLDDHRVFTDLLEVSLGLQPDLCCVAVAHTAREGLAKAAAVDFAVAVVDLQLPDAGGLDLIPQLLALRPQARIVVLTAHPRPDLAERAVAAGVVAFLGKDAALARILDAVRHAGPGHPVVGAAPRPSRVDLTHREFDVLRELGQGRDAARIAASLGISLYTTRDHIKSVMAKLGVHSQLDAVVSAERLGLITLGARY
ncbi:MAG: response regulator transcription factor [Pseudonocardia sp.]|nr:response regulator transcription factor [Pseudonocardia sp.]